MYNLHILIIIQGCLFLILGLVSLKYPRVFFGKRLLCELDQKQCKRPYIRHQCVTTMILSGTLIICGFLPDDIVFFVAVPGLLSALASAIFNNNRYLGRCVAWRIG